MRGSDKVHAKKVAAIAPLFHHGKAVSKLLANIRAMRQMPRWNYNKYQYYVLENIIKYSYEIIYVLNKLGFSPHTANYTGLAQ